MPKWAICFCTLAAVTATGENWPQFRGPRGDGTSLETGLPVKWDSNRNVVWKAALLGAGYSSPIVWGDRIFLTGFAPDRSAFGWLIGRRGQLLVVCLNRDTGRLVWQREVQADSIETVSNGNGPATPTPATDGQRLFVYFGSYGIVAFDFEGKRLWDLKLGPYLNHMGSASSLVISGDLLLLNCETDGPDFLIAVEKNTGKTKWKTPRKQRQAGYSTPVVWGDRIIVSGHETVKAYDARTGAELWAVGGMTTYVVPTPVIAHGLALVTSAGPGGNALLALRPDGTEAWRADRAASYVASPVVSGEWLFTVKDIGVMSCLRVQTGELVWQQRLPERGTYYASPVVAEARIYVANDQGATVVVAAKPKYELIAINHLGERCWASPAISARRIFVRCDATLYALGTIQ